MVKKKKWTILGKYQQACGDQNAKRRNDLKCAKCGLTKFLTVDHIIPVFLLEQFCLNDEVYNLQDNFQILCKFCNYQKRARIDVTNPKTFILLDAIIKKVKIESGIKKLKRKIFKDLGIKISKILHKSGIHNLEDLARQKDEDLLKLKGIGDRSILKINKILIRNNLR